jgi:triacylglycerol lipase
MFLAVIAAGTALVGTPVIRGKSVTWAIAPASADSLLDKLKAFGEKIKAGIGKIRDGVVNAYHKVADSVKGKVGDVLDKAKALWSSLSKEARGFAVWARDNWMNLWRKMKALWAAVKGEWWKSCDICKALPDFGQGPCSNVCEMLRTDYEKEKPTKYPIVFLHGIVRPPVGIYFIGVKEFLEKHGYTVYVPLMSSWNTPEQHVEFLKPYIQKVLKETGAPKVNLIGHSQGGLDARAYAALGGAPYVASVTSIFSPHRGSPAADDTVAKVEKFGSLGSWFFNLILNLLYPGVEGGAKGNWASIRQLTTGEMKKFNEKIKDQPGVKYFSYSGSSHPKDCPEKDNDKLHNILQVGLGGTWKTIFEVTKDAHNDGQVHHESAKWGRYLGDVAADHWDSSGMQFGLNDFDYMSFYLKHARFLKGNGL